jgi:hypothetical protein
MPQEQPQEEVSINEEAEAAAQADLERQFHSSMPQISDQVAIAAHLAEPMGRALGLEPSKVPGDFASMLQTLREQVSREPPPLDESRVRATGIPPTEE